MYDWRRMSDVEREALMRERRELKQPMYHITAACYEHRPIIGTSEKRLADFSTALVGTVEAWLTNEQERRHPAAGAIQPPKGGTPTDARIQPAKAGQPGPCLLAWVVMPNHYHLLVSCGDILGLLHELGRLHGRISHLWNGEDGQRGRQIWCKAAETAMKSDRHACVTLNYIHHNPVKHGVCAKWQDWPYSSATAWLERVGHEEATAFWAEYPVKEYGRKWDV